MSKKTIWLTLICLAVLLILGCLIMFFPISIDDFICQNIDIQDDYVSMSIWLTNSSKYIKKYKCVYKNDSLFVTIHTRLNWRSVDNSDQIIYESDGIGYRIQNVYVRTSVFAKYTKVYQALP